MDRIQHLVKRETSLRARRGDGRLSGHEEAERLRAAYGCRELQRRDEVGHDDETGEAASESSSAS
ncbi:hypothetical protein GCM10009629_23860 [Pseudonocardia alni]